MGVTRPLGPFCDFQLHARFCTSRSISTSNIRSTAGYAPGDDVELRAVSRHVDVLSYEIAAAT